MAMATAAAATVRVAPPASLFSDVASSECRRSRICRVQLGPLLSSITTAAPAAVASKENQAVVGSRSTCACSSSSRRAWRWQAVAEQLQAETEESSDAGFPSDAISIFFEAEGSLPEASVTKLTTTLEGVEGVSNVDITASSDGTATVKLTKQMNVQATGVASGLVEVLLKGGFKLQALNLGFDEDDGDDEDFYDYDLSSATEEAEAAE